ncbi:MAG: hypothetical protein KGR16_02425 [Verrucomicrobia bacterium]|nr:hypothetical protein [Verrucomicrobiota bacterium]MDE3047461.1 hypothetical protein [Verrucomicrobiota bacterium]
MNIREIIRKARQIAKTPDEVLLSERFEEYLDLLDMRTQVTQSEQDELNLRIERSLQALREVSRRVAQLHGMDPSVFTQFADVPNIGMGTGSNPAHGPMPMKTKKQKKERVRV